MSALEWLTSGKGQQLLRGCAIEGCRRRPRHRLYLLGHPSEDRYCTEHRDEMTEAYDGAHGRPGVTV